MTPISKVQLIIPSTILEEWRKKKKKKNNIETNKARTQEEKVKIKDYSNGRKHLSSSLQAQT